jgi:hypothetical protein
MRGIQLAAFLLPLIALPACTETAPASTAALSSEQRSELIERLQAAKKLGSQYARDPDVTPVTEEDFLDQLNKADTVIKEVTHRFEAPRQQIADALWVPPKSITPEERQRLIRSSRTLSERTTTMNKQCWTILRGLTERPLLIP